MPMCSDHPVIRNLERTGYPDGKLPEVVCPNCGAECATFYQDNADNHIIGCEYCVSRLDAVQHVMDSREDYIDEYGI